MKLICSYMSYNGFIEWKVRRDELYSSLVESTLVKCFRSKVNNSGNDVFVFEYTIVSQAFGNQ